MIGAGTWSNNQLTAWGAVEGVDIVALCDRDEARLNVAVSQFGIEQPFADAAAMFTQAELDFVDICARPMSHAALCRLAADHGLNILCQKPFCTSFEEAQEVIGYCHDAGVRLMINENFRWQGWYRKLKEVLDRDVIGKPFHASLHQRQNVTMPRFNHNQTYFKDMPLLIVYEMGIHYLDVMRFLFGDPTSLYARLHHISPETTGEDVEIVVLSYPEMTAVMQHSWASRPVPMLDYQPTEDALPKPPPLFGVDGTHGTISLQSDGCLTVQTHDGLIQQFTFDASVQHESRRSTQQHYVDCLCNDAPFESDPEDTLKTLQLVYATYESAESGQVITLT